MGELEQSSNHSTTAAELLARRGVLEALVCTITFLAYAGTIAFGFVYDDKPAIVDNPEIRSWNYLRHCFIPGAATGMGGPAGQTFYRPVTALWTRLNYVFFGLNPAGWHLAMLAGHVLTTYLVFVLARKLTAKREVAAMAPIVFGLHPAHVENVAWLSSVNDLLMTLLLAGSFCAYLKCREGAKLWMLTSLALFGLAMMTKETAAVFPILIFAYAVIFAPRHPAGERTAEKGARPALKEGLVAVPYFAVLAGYLVMRGLVLHGVVNSLTPLSWTTMFLTWPSVLWFDVRHLLLPVASSEFYPLAYVGVPGMGNFLLPIVLLLAAMGLAWYGISKLRERRLGIFALGWAVLSIMPTLYLRAVASENFVHDRFLYLPSVGVAILVALAMDRIGSGKTPGTHSAAVKWATVAVVCTAAFAGTCAYQTQWANNILLYTNGVATAPQNLVVRDNLANEFSSLGRYELAIPLYLNVLERNPRFWSSNYNLGYAYYRMGRFAEAESYLTRAIEIDDHDPDQYIFLARAQMQEGKLARAADNAERALELGPRSPGFHLVLARILEDSGERQRAIDEYKAEALYHPENAMARRELDRLHASQ